MVEPDFNLSREEKQMGPWEFRADLVHKELQDSQGYTLRPCLKAKQSKTKKEA